MAIFNYLEIIEILSEQESLERQSQIVRIEVENEVEAQTLLKKYEPVFTGLNYVKRILTQRHFEDSDRNQKCSVEPL